MSEYLFLIEWAGNFLPRLKIELGLRCMNTGVDYIVMEKFAYISIFKDSNMLDIFVFNLVTEYQFM